MKFIIFPIAKMMLNHYEYKFGISIPYSTQIGSGFYIGHFGTIVVNGCSHIGSNCNISHGVTLGVSNRGEKKGYPTLGNNVYLGPGAKIIGAITLGNNVAVGANCEQDPQRMLPLLREMRAATSVPLAAQPAAFHTTETCHSFTRLPAFPDDLETIQVSRSEFLNFGKAAKSEGIGFLGGCCGCNAAYIRSLARGVAEAK